MAITISNLRITPYQQKDVIKPVFGDVMSLTFTLPSPYVLGDNYMLGLDYERVLIPVARQVCAFTDEFSISGNNITFNMAINTARFRDWVSKLKKATPIWLQLIRERDDVYETILLDDVLALPSILDGANTVCPGDPIKELLDKKLDAPAEPGETGYVLSLAEDGSTAWIPQSGGGGSTSWNDITDKPDFASVATTGSYNDLSNKPAIPYRLSDLDSDTAHRTVTDEDKAAWDNKSDFSGSYNDLADKPTIPPAQVQADWDQSNTSAKDYIKNKPTIPPAQVQADWNETSTSSKAYIQNKPTIPAAQIQADWDQTSTSALDYIKNKPTIPTATDAATNAQIDSRSASQDIRPSNVEYAVRSVLPNVTTILAATTAYTLYDASATTNSHSAHYTHAPNGIPTYTLPAVTNTTIAHEILLDVDFTNVQACGFLDSQGAEIPLQSDIAIAAGDKWRFICVYSLDGWRVYPLPIEVADGGGGTATLIVQGTTATSAGLAGTYEITSDTVNDHPIWYNSTNSKYLWLVENGMDAGWFGWVIGSTVAQQSAGDIPMFYEYFVADVTSPADTPVGLTWRTQMDELTAAQFTCVEG